MQTTKTSKTSSTLDGMPNPKALLISSDASLREALREANHGHDVVEVLRKVLISRGYDVVVSFCPEEAKRLAQEQSFEKIFSDGTLPGDRSSSSTNAPIFHMQGLADGSVRVQIDHVMPPPVALALLDVLVDNAPDELPTFS
jgi:hypothetical protein